MRISRIAVMAGIAAAVAVGIVLAVGYAPGKNNQPEPEDSNFPVDVDFVRIVSFQNKTSFPSIARGYLMNARLIYPEGPPQSFYILFLRPGESWDQVTSAQEWVKNRYRGFEIISSSDKFDLLTEYYPFDSTLVPSEMRLYCGSCEEKWSEPQIVWQGVDEKISRLRGLIVEEGVEFYSVSFLLLNSQIDSFPADGRIDFRLTDSLGFTLYQSRFDVKASDFLQINDPIEISRAPMGGKAYFTFNIPVGEITASPSGSRTGYAFINFTLQDGRVLDDNTKNVHLPQQ